MALAHHGLILNAHDIRGELEQTGSIFQTTTDAEVLAHLIKSIEQLPSERSIAASLQKLHGSYAFMILTKNKLYAALDPYGTRPLSIGKMDNRSEEHTSELQSRGHLVCRLLLEKKNTK